jgi:glycosyltransferase involved in cell wall biosynthesis
MDGQGLTALRHANCAENGSSITNRRSADAHCAYRIVRRFDYPESGDVMAEAQACGKPVVAFGRGGAAEIVDHDVTGILFPEQSIDSLLKALEEFDRTSFDSSAIRLSALRFARQRFLSEFGTFVRDAMKGSIL